MDDIQSSDSQYENRVVAFIDILGFKQIIKNTMKDDIEFRKVANYLNRLKRLDNDSKEGNSGYEITVFSDSIVISCLTDEKNWLHSILNKVIEIQLDALSNRILMRGGISLGKLYHKENIVFGPAMVGAYELESKNAIHPRIVLTAGLVQAGMENLDEDKIEGVMEIIKLDTNDDFYFIDYLSNINNIEQDTYDILNELKHIIEDALANNTDWNIRNKYMWMKTYYNSFIEGSPLYQDGKETLLINLNQCSRQESIDI